MTLRGLMLVTDRRGGRHPVVDTAAAALAAGFGAVMLREKDLPAGPLLELAVPVADGCRRSGARFLVNDRLDVALALDGVGAHVGARGLPVVRARALLGSRLLGYSAHEADEAARALEDGADYVTLSPVHDPVSKPGAGRGLDFLRRALETVPADRVIALGGVTAATAGAIRACGVAGAAVSGAVTGAADPAAAAAELVAAWGAA